jgi:O-antigen ligase
MKNFAIKLVWFTTAYVLFLSVYVNQYSITSALSLVILELLILFMVYAVLTDQYTTTKTLRLVRRSS